MRPTPSCSAVTNRAREDECSVSLARPHDGLLRLVRLTGLDEHSKNDHGFRHQAGEPASHRAGKAGEAMTRHEFERRMVTAADNHAAGVRRDLVEISGEMRAADAALRRKRRAASLTERTGDSRTSSAGCGLVAARSPARESAGAASR